MHIEAAQFTQFVAVNYPIYFDKVNVLDVGGGDINGNNRYLFANTNYISNDVAPNSNVTIVCKTKDLPFADDTFDTIISTECFEHDAEYADSLTKIYKLLKPGGLFVFTCAGEGRAEHGTRRTSPHECLATMTNLDNFSDYYKNLNEKDIDEVLNIKNTFEAYDFYYNSHSKDLYFLGIKRKIDFTYPLVKYFNNQVENTTYRIL